jgi:D-tyrosyl-tRNA(Tyr) deacylase
VIGLLQRVADARVEVDGAITGVIGPGLLVLVCAEPGDGAREAERLVDKVLRLRVFGDGTGRMNRSLGDIGGGLLLVPQFTLAADLRGGNRPSFSGAAPPEEGHRLFHLVLERARARHSPVASGVFGAHMRVSLVNDGPVTLWLRMEPAQAQHAGAAGD